MRPTGKPTTEVIESSRIAVVVRPSTGARIVSLQDRVTGREWLVPPEAEPVPRFGASYTDRPVYGWDEMVPTIDPCGFEGVALPDHGELWSKPWESVPARHQGGSRLAAESVLLGLRLEREIVPDLDGSVTFHYDLSNRGLRTVPAYWAGHPMFQVSTRARVVLSPQPPTAEVTLPPERSGIRSWREVEALQAGLGRGEFLKVWIRHRPAAITITDDDDWLELSLTGRAIRDVALVWDRGAFVRSTAIAVEPATGGQDHPGGMWQRAGHLTARPGEELSWSLTLRLGSTRPPGVLPTNAGG